MAEHTMTPWKDVDLTSRRGPGASEEIDAGNYNPNAGYLHLMAPDGTPICDLFPFAAHRGVGYEQAKANAAFIVKAVNSHDALEAIRRAAHDYFMCAVQDEADDLECCISEKQHELAKALRDALAQPPPGERTEP